MALPMGELARLKAVTERVQAAASLRIGAMTERVPCGNHGTFSKFATANALSGSLIARQLPQRAMSST